MVVVAVMPHVVNGGGLSVGLYIYPVNQIMSNEDCWQWMSLLTTTDMVVVAVATSEAATQLLALCDQAANSRVLARPQTR